MQHGHGWYKNGNMRLRPGGCYSLNFTSSCMALFHLPCHHCIMDTNNHLQRSLWPFLQALFDKSFYAIYLMSTKFASCATTNFISIFQAQLPQFSPLWCYKPHCVLQAKLCWVGIVPCFVSVRTFFNRCLNLGFCTSSSALIVEMTDVSVIQALVPSASLWFFAFHVVAEDEIMAYRTCWVNTIDLCDKERMRLSRRMSTKRTFWIQGEKNTISWT